jgi:hypothetical protein
MMINRRNVGSGCCPDNELSWNIPSTNLRLPKHPCANSLMHKSSKWKFLTIGTLAAKQKQYITAITTFTSISTASMYNEVTKT